MRRRKNNKNFILVLLLVIVGGLVGYAALRTNLTINGETTVAKNTWSVKFTTITPVKNDGTITTTPVVTGDTTFRFGVKLNTPGDEYKVKVKVENQGTIDAMLSANPTLSGLEDMSSYLEYSVTYKDGISVEKGNLLEAGKSDEILVTLRFKKDISDTDLAGLATADVTKTMTFSMTYVQADNTAAGREKLVQLPAGKTKDNLVLGDEITVGTEQFNFVRYDGNNIVMLAKWNLNVGNNPKTAETFKQDSDVKGYIDGGTTYGNVAFSATNYWYDGSDGLKTEYGSSFPADVYDNTYKTAPDFTGSGYNTSGYSVAYYVEKYKKILEDMGLMVSEARLLTYTEATDSTIGIGCNGSNRSCPTTGFITNTGFWLGSTDGVNILWSVSSGGGFYYNIFSYDGNCGVRPVIVISKSEV